MKPCIIIGNGPSLSNVSFDFLDKYPTFGSNRIYTAYIPTYYVAVNPLVIEQFLDDIKAIKTEKFIRSDFAERIPGSTPLYTNSLPVFSRSPLSAVYEGFTVTFVSMQLAFYMEYDPVLLVGVDHRYKFEGKPNEERMMDGEDPNHFSSDYFKGVRWNNPDLAQSERSYRMAKTVYEHEGRRIINLGPDSALDIFEKGSIEQWA